MITNIIPTMVTKNITNISNVKILKTRNFDADLQTFHSRPII